MGEIIIKGATVAEVIALALSMQGGASVVLDDEDNAPVIGEIPAFDAEGLPWDARIHSENKGRTDKGAWRKKRGASKELIAAVESELRSRAAGIQQQQPVQQPMQMQTQPVMQQQPVQQQPMQMQTQPVQQQPMQMQVTQPVMQQQPVQQMQTTQPMLQQQPVQQQVAAAPDFASMMQAIQRGFTTPGADGQPLINAQYLAALSAHLGVGTITDLSTRPDLVPNAIAQIQVDGRWVNAA